MKKTHRVSYPVSEYSANLIFGPTLIIHSFTMDGKGTPCFHIRKDIKSSVLQLLDIRYPVSGYPANLISGPTLKYIV